MESKVLNGLYSLLQKLILGNNFNTCSMLQFKTIIKRFEKQGEKTGWTYIAISAKQAALLNAGVKTGYRVKGRLDDYAVEKMAIMPMGNGSFIMPLNAHIRKAIKKQKDATLLVQLELDDRPIEVDAEFMECLKEEPAAIKTFEALTKGHQTYFSKWIESAKTEPTKAKRIAMAMNALSKGWGFPEMLRANKKEKQEYGM